jgi:hypothetical protein
VHPICHINWLSCMDLNIHNNNPVTCPRHSIQYVTMALQVATMDRR